MDNPMGGSPSPQATPSPAPTTQGPQDPMDALSQAHDSAKARFDKVNEVGKQLSTTRAEFDKLVALGDSITTEDVIKGAGALVGSGADPQQILQVIANPQAPMPEGGQALAAWVQQQDQQVKQAEAALKQHQELAQHQLGVSALHVLAGHVMTDKGTAQPQPQPSPGGPATPNPMGG